MSVGWRWRIAKKALFQVDAETVHLAAMRSLHALSRVGATAPKSSDVARAPNLAKTVCGIDFPNPLGLAAGLDKEGECVPALFSLGFGFVEVGTVTAQAQPGNPRPRLFRLKDDEALMNRMGFNNAGKDAMARHLDKWRRQDKVWGPLGVNIGRTKVVSNADAPQDLCASFSTLADFADYMVVNVSSPNTPGLRDLQTRDEVVRILGAVTDENQKRSAPRPIFLKLAPDLDDEAAMTAADAAIESGADGLILTNTTISRDGLKGPVPDGTGGISGRPLFDRSTALLRVVAKHVDRRVAIIGVGGVMDAEDAQQKLDAGADLVQAYSGFIYAGPGFARSVLRGLRPGSE